MALVGSEAEGLVEIGMAKDGSGVGGELLFGLFVLFFFFSWRPYLVPASSCTLRAPSVETGTERRCRERRHGQRHRCTIYHSRRDSERFLRTFHIILGRQC